MFLVFGSKEVLMARSGGKNIQAKLVGMFSPLQSFLIFCGNGLVRRSHCRVLCFSLEISNGRKSFAVNYVQGLTTVWGFIIENVLWGFLMVVVHTSCSGLDRIKHQVRLYYILYSPKLLMNVTGKSSGIYLQ